VPGSISFADFKLPRTGLFSESRANIRLASCV
jgi:hypothetical protein